MTLTLDSPAPTQAAVIPDAQDDGPYRLGNAIDGVVISRLLLGTPLARVYRAWDTSSAEEVTLIQVLDAPTAQIDWIGPHQPRLERRHGRDRLFLFSAEVAATPVQMLSGLRRGNELGEDGWAARRLFLTALRDLTYGLVAFTAIFGFFSTLQLMNEAAGGLMTLLFAWTIALVPGWHLMQEMWPDRAAGGGLGARLGHALALLAVGAGLVVISPLAIVFLVLWIPGAAGLAIALGVWFLADAAGILLGWRKSRRSARRAAGAIGWHPPAGD